MDGGGEHQRNQLVPFTEGDICQEKTTRCKSGYNNQVLHSMKAHHRVGGRSDRCLHSLIKNDSSSFKRSFGEPTRALERLILQQSPSNLTDLHRICSISGFLNPDVQILYRHTGDASGQSSFPSVVQLNAD